MRSRGTSWRTRRSLRGPQNRITRLDVSGSERRSRRARARGPSSIYVAILAASAWQTTRWIRPTHGSTRASGSPGPDGELVPDYESTFPTINEGEVVHGTVVRVDKDEVLVDIGYKSEGVIPVAELSIRRSINPADEVSVGDEIDALVLTKEDADGRLILSKKRARFELAWKSIEAAAESGQPVIGRVIEVVKGGLILDLGVRGFLPASLVDIRRVQDLDEFMGKELRCKVIELNRSRNNVVLSRRAVLEDERKEMRQAILDRLNPGDVVDGQISNIVDFGAFVDLDGMDGLIHISELSWSHVNHPSEVLEIGQDVKVKVLDIDRDRQRISLGLKQTQSDPWQQVVESYSEDDVVEGRVTKVVTFGAFVEILPGVEGLVHISELAQHHVENPREVVAQGQVVNVLILEIDAERRRLSLSLKRVEEGAAPRPRPGEEPSGRTSISRRTSSPSRRRPSPDARGPFDEVDARRRGPSDEPMPRAAASRTRVARTSSTVEEPVEALVDEAEAAEEPRGARTRASRAPRSRSRSLEDAAELESTSGRRACGRGCEEPSAAARRGAGRRGSRRRDEPPAQAAEEADDRRRAPPRRTPASPTPQRPTSARAPRPLAVAITGGIGAGKSEALQAFARHGAATVSSDEIVHRLLREDAEAKRGDRRAASAPACSARTARSTARPSRAIVFRDPAELAWLEALLHPRVVARVPDLARGARPPPGPAGRLRDRGSAPLRGRRRDALRRGRRRHGAAAAARGAHARHARRPRLAPASRPREAEARGLRLRQHRLARGARRVGRGRRRAARGARVSAGLVLVVLALVAAAAAGVAYVHETKPAPYARLLYPLRYEAIIAGHAENYRLEPALLAAVIYQESKFERGRPLELGRDRADAAPARHGAGDRRPHRRDAASSSTTSTSPELNVRYGSWYLRHLLDKYGERRARARGLQRRADERRQLARAGRRHPLPGDARVRGAGARSSGGSTRRRTRSSAPDPFGRNWHAFVPLAMSARDMAQGLSLLLHRKCDDSSTGCRRVLECAG